MVAEIGAAQETGVSAVDAVLKWLHGPASVRSMPRRPLRYSGVPHA